MKKKTKLKKALLIVIIIIAALVVSAGVYLSIIYHADANALNAIEHPAENVKVINEENKRILFIPDNPKAGFVFYPGAKVQYEAYAPLMNALAKEGVLCALVHMPVNLAVFGENAAEGITGEFPEIDRWYIGGHSLGGFVTPSYILKHPGEFDGLVLLASYPNEDVSKTGIKAVSIYGSNDGVMNRENYKESLSKLPADTKEVVIDGGNHAGFGSYGTQDGDGEATISGEDQIAQTVKAITESIFMNN